MRSDTPSTLHQPKSEYDPRTDNGDPGPTGAGGTGDIRRTRTAVV
jgi:hypothetical protein